MSDATAWLCRDNRAPAANRGVMFVGGPNTAAYARPQYARRTGGPAGPSTIQAQIQENIARHGERAPEGPPQVNMPTCRRLLLQLLCSQALAVHMAALAFASADHWPVEVAPHRSGQQDRKAPWEQGRQQ